MRIDFDFLDLEAFLAVKETGSFHRAAERLRLSQSSVTRRVRKLEEALGTALFERTTRDVRPTLAAKRLQMRAEAMIEDARETARAMRDESAASARAAAKTVTVAAIPTAIGGLLAPAFNHFRENGGRERIRILDLAANEVAEAVAGGDADFGVCSVPMLEPTTEFSLLLDDALVIALPDRHPLLSRRSVAWRDLADERLILPARGTGNRLLIDEALARGADRLRWTYEIGRSTTALALVAEGAGIAALPRMALTGADVRRVRWRPLTDPWITRPIGLLTRFGHTERPAVATLKSALRAVARVATDRPLTEIGEPG